MGDEMPTDDGTDDMGIPAPEMGDETEISGEPKEGYQSVMDSIFAESKVEKTINKYLNESVIKETKIKNENKKKLMIESVNKMATTYEQEGASKRIIKEFKEVELIGRTNKKNIVVKINGEEFKINQKGLLE